MGYDDVDEDDVDDDGGDGAGAGDGDDHDSGSGRLNLLYFTCLGAQNVDKFLTFARFLGSTRGPT